MGNNWNCTKPQKHYEMSLGKYTRQQFALQANGKYKSGITFELKRIFEDLAKRGILNDSGSNGMTKKEAYNMYLELDKIHKEQKRARNYTSMAKGQEFDYSDADISRLARAAGFTVKMDIKHIAVNDHIYNKKPEMPKIYYKS